MNLISLEFIVPKFDYFVVDFSSNYMSTWGCYPTTLCVMKFIQNGYNWVGNFEIWKSFSICISTFVCKF